MNSSDSSRSRVLFEGSFKESFLHLAHSEGLISLVEERDDVIESILADMRRARKRKEVLERLLLFDDVLLYGTFDCFDVTNLTSAGLSVGEVKRADFWKYGARGNTQTDVVSYIAHDAARRIKLYKPLILPFVRRRWKHINTRTYDGVIDRLTMPETRSFIQGEMSLREFVKTLPRHKQGRDLAGEIEAYYEKQKPEAIEMAVRRLGQQVFNGVFMGQVLASDDIVYAFDVLESSMQRRAPVASTCVPRAPHPSALLPRSVDHSKEEAQVLRVIMREVEFFPAAESLGQVLRLRSDKRISDFRGIVREWATALEAGDEGSLLRLTAEMRRANRGMRHLRNVRRVSGFLKYVLAPLGLLEPLSLSLTALSMGVQAYTHLKEHKYRWMMLGA